MKLFNRTTDISIVLASNADEAIRLAAKDLQSNLRRLSGRSSGFDIVEGEFERGIFVTTSEHESVESYTVTIEKDRVMIDGSDTLGTIFGIYAFATKFLKINPAYRLIDLFPDTCEEIELAESVLTSPDRVVRFRGWFLNDEDLLCDYKLSGGHRHIDYRFYENVADESVLDMIIETALRLEINMMIPASFLDIHNPDEEVLVRAVCKRGMYVTQHHIETLGVSYFTADNYMKAHGHEDEAVSFISNRARMEEIWRHYAEKWATYGDKVIWQFGLRGKADQAVWVADPNVPDSMEARGAVITDAIRTQYEIVKDVLGTEDFYSTSTLWNEGSELYGKGYLTLPKGTIAIFADHGPDQMFGEDFYTVPHEKDRKYGIYYHAAFQHIGPHFAEGCEPKKMAYCYHDAKKLDNLYYSILNISNVRPIHISAIINARIMQSPLNFNADEELLKLDRELFSEMGDEVNALRQEYYGALADLGVEASRRGAIMWSFYFRDFDALPFTRNVGGDGQLSYFGKSVLKGKPYSKLPPPDAETHARFRESAYRYADLYKKAEALDARLSGQAQIYFRQFLKHQIYYLQKLYEWCMGCIELMNETLPAEVRVNAGKRAAVCIEEIIEDRKVLEEGVWENWHRGDKKLDFPKMLKMTRSVTERILNEA